MSAHPAASLPELPRFEVSEYRPDGGFSVPGVGMLVSALVLIGAALGFVAHWVSQYIYLILLFPALIGLALGFVGQRMVRTGHVRNPLIGGLAGLLGGVLAMGMMHYFDYETFKKEVEALQPEIRALAQMTPQQRAQVLREDLTVKQRQELEMVLKAVKVASFFQYMDLEAQRGVELKKTGSSVGGINLGYWGSYTYWIIEVLIVAGITLAMVKEACRQPYCTGCDQWKTLRLLGYFGSGPAMVAAAIRSGDLNSIREMTPTSNPTDLRLTAAACTSCMGQGDVDLKLESLSTDNKGNVKPTTVAHVRYPAGAFPYLEALFAAPEA